MHVAEENPIGSLRFLMVIKGQSYDVFKISWVLVRPNGRVEVIFIRKVNASQNGPLGVQQVALVPVASQAILSEISMSAGAGLPIVPQIKTKLMASSVSFSAVVRTWVSWKKKRDQAPYGVSESFIT